jgi:CubicO group peptidase (beta-lactamase class C family)
MNRTSHHSCRLLRDPILTLLFALLCSGCANDTIGENRLGEIRADIEAYLETTGVPSIAVAVAKDGRIIWEEGFGWADRECEIRATPRTVYQIGSVTKNFTATAMMLLVERGLVDLDTPANDYLCGSKLRGCWCDPAEATVRRLLLHTAGLQDFWNSYYGHEVDRKMTTDEAIRRHGVLIYTPGEEYRYSSLGYGVAGQIIECVSGMTYEEFLEAELLEPLGLEETAARATSEPAPGMAQKYDRDGGVCPVWLPNFAASGFVYSSAHDLVRYGMFHLENHLDDQHPVLSDRAIDMMKTASDAMRPAGTKYALGWGVYYMDGFRVVSHGGGGPGIDAELVLIPSENVAIAVLANSRAGRSSEICKLIAEEVLPALNLGDVWRAFASIFDTQGTSKHASASAFRGEWAGAIKTYQGNISIHLSIDADNSARVRRTSIDDGPGEWIPAAHGMKVKQGNLDLWFNAGLVGLDPDRPEDYMRLIVRREGSELRGSASAGCDRLGPGRSIFYLPACVELTRTEHGDTSRQ